MDLRRRRERRSPSLRRPTAIPDFGQSRLIAALSGYTGVPAEQIIAGAGLDDVLTSLAHLIIDPGDEVIISEPTFGVYRVIASLHGGSVVNVPLTPAFPNRSARDSRRDHRAHQAHRDLLAEQPDRQSDRPGRDRASLR